jgi:hypothetical protein
MKGLSGWRTVEFALWFRRVQLNFLKRLGEKGRFHNVKQRVPGAPKVSAGRSEELDRGWHRVRFVFFKVPVRFVRT